MIALALNLSTTAALKCVLGVALVALVIPLTKAQTINLSAHSGYARYHYEEPGLMQLSGHLSVIGGRALVNFDAGYSLIAEGKYAQAEVEYASPRSGSSHGQPLSIVEFRLLAAIADQWRNLDLQPFTGVGVRGLNNNAQGLTTTNGDNGYLRVSAYQFLPLGVYVDVGSSIRIKIEYDHLLSGRQESHLSGEIIQNRQSRGHGYHVSINASYGKWVAESYIQRWNIAASNAVNCLGGFQLCREPENVSSEFGVNLRYLF